MNRRFILRTVLPGLFCLALPALPALACKVPVFRYALERWQSDDYRAVVIYREDSQGEVNRLTKQFEAATTANLEVETLNLDALTEAQLWEHQGLEEIGAEPVMRLFFPLNSGRQEPFWQGPFTAESVQRTLNSPLRKQLTDSILAGSATTWVIIESDDELKNTEAASKLQQLLQQNESSLTIPDGVVAAEELDADGLTADGAPVEMDDVLRTKIPLKIAFPILRVSPDDAAESVFLDMLRAVSEGTASEDNEPMAIPIFGRGRCMPGIPASRINAATVGAACQYLCGECSCQVKDQNPGMDLLLSVDWAEKLQDSFAIVERELPELSGLGIAAESPKTEESVVTDVTEPATTPAGEGKESRIAGVLGYTLIGLLVASIAGTFLVMNRGNS